MSGEQPRLRRVRAHSSLGIGERYHEPLKRIYRKIKFDHPTIHPPLILRVAIKAMNDTIRENGFVPSRIF